MRLFFLTVTTVVLSSLAPLGAHAFSVAMPTTWSAEAAIETLRAGGNAADAIVAGAFALNVSQPYNMGIGGGGFMLLSDHGKVSFWNSREIAPQATTEDQFLDKDGKPVPYYPQRVTGPKSVGVPGTVAGLFEMHRRYGRLPWKKLLAPAIRLANGGFPVTTLFADTLADEWPRISAFPTTVATFGDGSGGPIKRGHLLRQPVLARTLERIAAEGARAFYKGPLADQWISEARKINVPITTADLERYHVDAPKPISFALFGFDGFAATPPSSSGLMVVASLRFLEHYYKTHPVPSPESPARVIVTTETLKFFQRLRDEKLADAPYGKIDVQKYLGSRDEREAWAEIEKNITEHRDRIETAVTLREERATATLAQGTSSSGSAKALDAGASCPGQHTKTAVAESAARPRPPSVSIATAADSERSHTAHMSIIDDAGMAVAFTDTIEQWFGSGMVVPGFGFLLNNELTDFTAEKGLPNSPAPGKRPRSNMSPLILLDHGKPVAIVGCAGGSRIPTTLVEILEGYYIHQLGLREAFAFPRFHPDSEGKLEIEPAFTAALAPKLKEAGYDVVSADIHSTPHGIIRRTVSAPWEAAAEPRADGLAITIEPRKR